MKNNIQTILFASLLVAMILPFSTMSLAEAIPNENANEKAKEKDRTNEFKENAKKNNKIRDELQIDYNEFLDLKGKIKNAEKKTSLSSIEDKQLKENKKRSEELSNKFEVRQKELHKNDIPEAKLNKMMENQDEFETELIKTELIQVVTSVGIDLATKEIQIGLNQDIVNDSNINDIVSQMDAIMPKNTNWHFVYSDTIQNLACNQSQCAPLIGGNEIRIDNGQSSESDWKKCSFGYKAKKGSSYGIVTAGHCLDGYLNKDVHDSVGTAIGYTVSESYYWGTSCDCGWILAGNSLIDNKVYLDSSTQTTITKTTSDTSQQNDDIVKSGITTGATVGTVSAINVSGFDFWAGYYVKDLVRSNLNAQKGDSGGTVVELGSENDLYGVLSGKDSNGTYHEPVNNLNSVLGVTPILG